MKAEEERANQAIEGEIALMAYTPEIFEDQETEKDWKAESERLMNMVGWGDDDDDDEDDERSVDTSSVPPLIYRKEDDDESSVSSCDG